MVGNDLLELNLRVIDGSPARKLENGQARFRFKAAWRKVDFSFDCFHGYSADPRAQFRNKFTRAEPTRLSAIVETKYPRNHLGRMRWIRILVDTGRPGRRVPR